MGKRLAEMSRAELRLLLGDAQAEVTERVAVKNRASSRVDKAVSRLRTIKAELVARDGKEVTVSEHAIVRYLERSGRIVRSEIEAEMISDELVAAIREGNTSYEDERGFKFKLNAKSFVVTTVLSPDMVDLCDED